MSEDTNPAIADVSPAHHVTIGLGGDGFRAHCTCGWRSFTNTLRTNVVVLGNAHKWSSLQGSLMSHEALCALDELLRAACCLTSDRGLSRDLTRTAIAFTLQLAIDFEQGSPDEIRSLGLEAGEILKSELNKAQLECQTTRRERDHWHAARQTALEAGEILKTALDKTRAECAEAQAECAEARRELAAAKAALTDFRGFPMASTEHIRRVVREQFAVVSSLSGETFATRHVEDIATRVAARLAQPLLSTEERAELLRLRANEQTAFDAISHLDLAAAVRCGRTLALLDRLLAS